MADNEYGIAESCIAEFGIAQPLLKYSTAQPNFNIVKLYFKINIKSHLWEIKNSLYNFSHS